MKRFVSLILVGCIICNVCMTEKISAKINAFDKLSKKGYANVYTMERKDKISIYLDKKLSTRGNLTFGKKKTAYVNGAIKKLRLHSVGKHKKGYWAQISFIAYQKRIYAYVDLSVLTPNNLNHILKQANGKFFCSYRLGENVSKKCVVNKYDMVYLIGKKGKKYQIMCSDKNEKWKIVWCSEKDYNKYCLKETTDKISFIYNTTETKYTYSKIVELKVNGTEINVGSTFYTYTKNGGNKTTGSPSGYTYAKVGNNYYDMNGWQCCAYARYIQFLMYGKQDFANRDSFKSVSEATGKLATASETKKWIHKAGVGAHIRSKRPHSLIVIRIDKNGFYYTDANNFGNGRVRVGYFTWKGFAESDCRYIDKITFYSK